MSGIKKVGVIGEGKMGSSIFNYLLDFPYELVWVCSAGSDTDKIIRQFGKRIRRMLESGMADQAAYERLLATPITRDVHALADCDLVIEAIPEDRELKKILFAELDTFVKPGALFTSNSSSILPSSIMPAGRANRFAGLHFFYPVPLKDIVEITLAPSANEETRKTLEFFLDSIRRRFITTDESNAFILNRVFLEVQVEAFRLAGEGACTMAQADRLIKEHLFPFGAFDFCDSVGLDTMLASVTNYTAGYPDRDRFAPFLSALSALVSEGKMGMKTGEGFYRHPVEETEPGIPEQAGRIVGNLRKTWLRACADFTEKAGIPTDRMNHASREYFGLETGPFETGLL